MPTAIIMPRVDMDMATGKIARWLVEPGASVRAGDALFEIETDKATMEIEAAAAGTVNILVTASGTDIKVGSVVAEILGPGESATHAPPETAAAEPASATPAAAPAIADPEIHAPHTTTPPPTTLRATPLARRQARLHDIDLATITGSGPRGRITSRDLGRDLDLHRPHPPAKPTPSPQSPTIVYLHGFAGSAASWAPLRARLPHHRHLALDLPGHGHAEPLADASLDALTESLIATIAREAAGPIHLVGHSLGGAIATSIALAGRLPVASLLLIAPAGFGPEIDGAFIAGILRAHTPASLTPWLERLVTDPRHLTQTMTTALHALLADPARRGYLTALAANAFPDGTQSAELLVDASDLPMPASLIAGAADRIVPFRHTRRIGPSVGVHLCPDIGHLPQIEAVNLVARIQRELLATANEAMLPAHS